MSCCGSRRNSCNRRCEKISITARDIPYFIGEPGIYQLCDDLIFSSTLTPAITILSSDVSLDLGGHTINLASTALNAILIGDPTGQTVLENIDIYNGTIRNGPLTQALAIATDIYFPLVAQEMNTPPGVTGVVVVATQGPSTNYVYPPLPADSPAGPYLPFDKLNVGAIIAHAVRGVSFRKLSVAEVLYGIIVASPQSLSSPLATTTMGYIEVDNCNFYDFGVSFPPVPPLTGSTVAYGSGVVLAGTPSNYLVDLRVHDSEFTSENAQRGTIVFSGDGSVWERVTLTANAGPNPGPTQNPLIIGPCLWVNSIAGICRECESRNSNTMFEIQYCKAFEFVDCTAWESFHNGFGILFSSDIVLDRCQAHRAEGLLVPVNGITGPVASGSGIKINISSFVTVKQCVFTGWNIPGGLVYAPGGGVTGTPLTTDSNGAGIAIAAADYNTIIDNVTSGNTWGIKEIRTTTLRNSPSQTYIFAVQANFGPAGTTGSNSLYRNISNSNGLEPVGATGSYVPASLPSNYLILNAVGNPIISTNANGAAAVAPYVNLQP
jgi:hypothetical protein